MGTLFSALSIARSGMQVAQVQLDTAGHNIANANKPGFSRQRVDLISRTPILRSFGQIGRGVAISNVSQIRDPFLDTMFRNQVAGLQDAQIRSEFFSQVEDVFLEPGDRGLGGRINRFFESLQAFSVNVESPAVRESVLTEAQALAGLFNETAQRIDALRSGANEEIISFVPEINSLAERIGGLNRQIRIAEVGGKRSNDLRDDRNLLLDELAGIANIFTRERVDGQVDVLIGETSLVNGDRARLLKAVQNPSLDPIHNDFVDVQFVDNGEILQVQDGELFGAFELRDTILLDIQTEIDTLAAGIIREINVIHSQGNGLEDLSTLTGSNAVTDPTVALGSAGLPFPITPGTFEVNVFDAAGLPVGGTPATITILAGTSLNDVVAALNAVPQLTASVNPDGQLQIDAAAGFSFSFSNDSTGVLASLGSNGLFTGTSAATMGVNSALVNNSRLLSSAFSTDPEDTGDNSAALAMADVQNALVFQGGTSSVNDFYEALVVQIGIDARANNSTFEIEQTFVESFQRRRQEISGVSLDEEVTMMLMFQRAFEASARVITVTDRMLSALMAMAL